MAFNGFDEDDYTYMRKPGQKVQLTERTEKGTEYYHVATVVSYNETNGKVTLKSDVNRFMKHALVSALPKIPFERDLRTIPHVWIEGANILYCYACHSMDLTNLFWCNEESCQKPWKVAFHAQCLDAHLGHSIPTVNNARTWKCPMHNNQLAKLDPSSLHGRKRKGDYDFDFERPLKKRRITVEDPQWLQLSEDTESVYPQHITCDYCVTEGLSAQCDGNRPCNMCCQYVKDEIMDLTQPRFTSMDEDQIQLEVDKTATPYCRNRRASFAHFENDVAMREWLKVYDNKLYLRFVQEKRERDHRKEEEIGNQFVGNDSNNVNNVAEKPGTSRKQSKDDELPDKLVEVELEFKAPEFVSSVPIVARYQCAECLELFGDKYRFQMHRQWAHQKLVVNQKAIRKEGILNHFYAEKPLKYSCPYSGCLRGANSTDEIEDHILRHHDLTDPTKPKNTNEERDIIERETKVHECPVDVKIPGVAYLTEGEKRRLSNVWHQSKATRIDKENSLNLIKNFVSAIVDDQIDKFEETTKRLQRKYAQDMEAIAQNNQKEARMAQSTHVPRHDLLPIPVQHLTHVPEEVADTEDSGPKSLWQ